MLPDHKAIPFLLQLCETSVRPFEDRNIIGLTSRESLSQSSPQVPVAPDPSEGEQTYLELFQSDGLKGSRWKFENEEFNTFFIDLFKLAAKSFKHDLALNDLYHAHIAYLDYLEKPDLAIVFHAKEAPKNKFVRAVDQNANRLYLHSKKQFDVDDPGVRHRNMIYFLRSNKLVAYDNLYQPSIQDEKLYLAYSGD